MKIHIQLDSQCEEPEILIRTAAVTAEIRELVEKSQGNTAQKRLLHPTVQKAFPFLVCSYFENRPSSSLILLHIYRSIQPSKSVIFMAEPAIIREFSPPGKPPGGKPLYSPSPP